MREWFVTGRQVRFLNLSRRLKERGYEPGLLSDTNKVRSCMLSRRYLVSSGGVDSMSFTPSSARPTVWETLHELFTDEQMHPHSWQGVFFNRKAAGGQKALECRAGTQEPRLIFTYPSGRVVLAADRGHVPCHFVSTFSQYVMGRLKEQVYIVYRVPGTKLA